MKNIIIINSKYQTTHEIANYIKSNIDSKIVTLDQINGEDLNEYNNIILISSIYYGKPLKNTQEKINKISNNLKSKNTFLMYCSGSENSEYLNKCYCNELVDSSNVIGWVGSSLDINNISIIDKLSLKMSGRGNSYSNIQYNKIDEMINKLMY